MSRWDRDWFRRLHTVILDLPFREPSERQAIRRELGRDPIAFAVLYMAKHIQDRSTGGITFAECHFDWARLAETWRTPPAEPGEDRHAFIAPRNVGKSTWWFLILPMWAAAYGHKRFAAAFASAAAQAEGHLGTFKRELETNPLLRSDFPELCAPARRERGGTVADRQGMLHTSGGFVFAARGIDSAVLGMKVGETRPDLLIMDDIEPDEASYSPLQAEKRLGTVTDAILPLNVYASVVMVGTVTMPGSVMHQLVKISTGVDEGVDEALKAERIRPHYSPAILVNDDGTERSIWPEKWSMEYLESIRHTRSFAKNYANDPMGRDGLYWTADDFRYGELAGVTRVALFVDPAVTARKTSDFTGLAVVGYAPPGGRERGNVDQMLDHVRGEPRGHGRCIVLEAAGVKLTGRALRDHILKILERWPQIRRVVVEVNQGGDLWHDVFSGLPVKVVTHVATEAKEIRFAEALEFYQRRQVVHLDKIRTMEEQMVSFPKVPHDDVADAGVAGVLYFLAPDRRVRTKVKEAAYV